MASTPEKKARFDYPEDPLMRVAWRDCLMWSLGFKPIQDDFARSPGGPLRLARTPIEAMIDKASGFEDAELVRYISWFNENVWGSEDDDEEK